MREGVTTMLDGNVADMTPESIRELREDNEGLALERDIWRRTAEVEQAENDKLRELVRALDWCTENADVRDKCDRCPLEQSDACEPECEVMMRELGVMDA